MKKSDLKTGMIIETRGGQRGLIALDNCYGQDAVIFHEESWTGLSGYNDDLIWHEGDPDTFVQSMAIMKVYKPNLPTGFLSRKSKKFSSNGYYGFSCEYGEMELLWERKEVPEFTMEEIIKKVGFEFKIKK